MKRRQPFRAACSCVLLFAAFTTLNDALPAQRHPSPEAGIGVAAKRAWPIVVVDQQQRLSGQLDRKRHWLRTAFGYVDLRGAEAITLHDGQAERAHLKAMIAAIPSAMLKGRLDVARHAHERGLTSEALELLEAILSRDPDHEGARDLSAAVLRPFVLHRHEGRDRPGDLRKSIGLAFSAWARAGYSLAAGAEERLSAWHRKPEAWQGGARNEVARLALAALRRGAAERQLGARLLASRRDLKERVAPLYRMSLRDPVAAVRRAAVAALAPTDEGLTSLYVKNLGHAQAAVRLHAVQAIGQLGAVAAAPALVRVAANPGRPVRNHILIGTQRAYVKDFDVAVAQGAIIADPVVDVLTEGALLDVGLISVHAVRGAAFRSLVAVSGQDFGTDLKRWSRWAASR